VKIVVVNYMLSDFTEHKPTINYVIKKYSVFYRTRNSVTEITEARQWTLP